MYFIVNTEYSKLILRKIMVRNIFYSVGGGGLSLGYIISSMKCC